MRKRVSDMKKLFDDLKHLNIHLRLLTTIYMCVFLNITFKVDVKY